MRFSSSCQAGKFQGLMVWFMAYVLWQVSYGEPLHVGRIEEEVEIDDKSIGHLEEYAKEILQLLKEGAIKYPIGKR